jgi:hypothetical protein
MDTSAWGPLVIWLGINALAVPLTWQLIWPTYKRYGKVAVSLVASAVLSWAVGWWSLLFILGHPLAGIAGHIWWCKRHKLPVLRPDPDAYRRTQEKWADDLAKRTRRNVGG